MNSGEMTKKRNKSSTKSYNNKDPMIDHDLSYSTNLVKKGNGNTTAIMDIS